MSRPDSRPTRRPKSPFGLAGRARWQIDGGAAPAFADRNLARLRVLTRHGRRWPGQCGRECMTSETGIEPGRPSSGAFRAPDAGGRGRPRPRLLFLVTEDWYFLSHRLPMARAAREAGFEVHVAARVREGRARIEAEGFVLHALPWRRADFGIGLPSAVAAVRSLYARLDPDLIHHVALKPALLGS